ncbi:MAG: TIGR00296 family protein [Nitrososphaerota archaeon]
MLSDEEGTFLVKLARNAITSKIKGEKPRTLHRAPEALRQLKRGVFVTLNTYPELELRGCIGFPYPVKDFLEQVVDAALSAAFGDPRFPPLSKDELDRIVVEVSVLTIPEEIAARDRKLIPSMIEIGRDGLIIESPFGAGLLLPQVPVEYGWDAEEFLTNLCFKAGLPPTFWLTGTAVIKRFTAEIFAEKEPNGEVNRVDIKSIPRKAC